MNETHLDHQKLWQELEHLRPAGLPETINQRLNQALMAILSEPETEKYLSGLGIISARSSPAEFQRFVQEQIALWARLSKDSGREIT